MQKAINTLKTRIEALQKEYVKAELQSNNPEMLSDYVFAKNDMENIKAEITELQSAINKLK